MMNTTATQKPCDLTGLQLQMSTVDKYLFCDSHIVSELERLKDEITANGDNLHDAISILEYHIAAAKDNWHKNEQKGKYVQGLLAEAVGQSF